jgi:hypothetical protein
MLHAHRKIRALIKKKKTEELGFPMNTARNTCAYLPRAVSER